MTQFVFFASIATPFLGLGKNLRQKNILTTFAVHPNGGRVHRPAGLRRARGGARGALVREVWRHVRALTRAGAAARWRRGAAHALRPRDRRGAISRLLTDFTACTSCVRVSPLAATLFGRILDVCQAIAHMLLTTEGSFKKDLKKLPDPDMLSKASSVQKVPLCPGGCVAWRAMRGCSRRRVEVLV